MTVSAILSTKGNEVATASPHRTLSEIAKTLAEKKIGAILITGSDGGLKGIISERDIVRAVATKGGAALEDPASMHMTAKVVTCRRDDMIADVMEEMTKGRFRHLPVVENGRLIGIISIGDVVKHRIAETVAESQSLRDYIQMAS
ncbi:MAG: CBS domain-containing protein [Beijerinckiaceae bacterium]